MARQKTLQPSSPPDTEVPMTKGLASGAQVSPGARVRFGDRHVCPRQKFACSLETDEENFIKYAVAHRLAKPAFEMASGTWGAGRDRPPEGLSPPAPRSEGSRGGNRSGPDAAYRPREVQQREEMESVPRPSQRLCVPLCSLWLKIDIGPSRPSPRQSRPSPRQSRQSRQSRKSRPSRRSRLPLSATDSSTSGGLQEKDSFALVRRRARSSWRSRRASSSKRRCRSG